MASRSRTGWLIGGGAAGAAALALVLWSLRSKESAAAPSASDMAEPPPQALPAAEPVVGDGADEEARSPVAAAAPEPAPQAALTAESPAALEGPALALEQQKKKLLDSMEASLLGVIEPEVFLEAALQLVQLEVDPRANPEPDGTGWMSFKILGTPPGMTAELQVARARNPNLDVVVSLRFSIDPPREPYVAEGLSRAPPEAMVTIWRDLDGAVKNFTVAANLMPDGRTNTLGAPLNQGEVPFGTHYSMNVDDPSKSVASMSGMQDGTTTGDLKRQTQLGAQPQLGKVEELSRGMQTMYAKAKQ
jgi:hypothetical protein